MKYCLIVFVLLLLMGCKDGSEDVKAGIKPAQQIRDTNPIQKQVANPYSQVDLSPMDMTYFPDDYPIQKMSGKAPALPVARVIYSRPHRQGRTIFGGLLKYGEPWRLGANEATEIELFQTVTIQNKKVPKGRYILYCLPQPEKWTIVFNENLFTWGLRPDATKDLMKFDIPIGKTPVTLEYFTMSFERTKTGADLLMAWENLVGRLPLQF